MSKWIVAVDMAYYPYIEEYDTYEEAKERFDKEKEAYEGDPVAVYLAEVKEVAE